MSDPAGIAAVVDADSVVLSGLGAEQAGTLLAGAKAVVAAGPRRITWLGAYGTGESADAAGEGADVLGKLLGDRLADKVKADNTVLAAGARFSTPAYSTWGRRAAPGARSAWRPRPRSTSARR
ncbi:hypothetical protein OG417_29180 [Actinoallomurus sp. NBC_01490]|uniref:hypothetical protein n=1 Tax=Actinoallomurus sp. NBC_01490 TaxID=2903557 RepID=UPI002E37F3D1|nr:hypothetical protein [Actinoallomurus sp. NBC_01490]